MARLRRLDPEDAAYSSSPQQATRATSSKPSTRSSPRKKATRTYHEQSTASDDSNSCSENVLKPKSTPKPIGTSPGKQRRLAPLQAASISKPLQIQPLLLPKLDPTVPERRRPKRTSFSRKLASPVKKRASAPPLSESSEAEEDVEVEVEESVWCGSDAGSGSDFEAELPSPRKFLSFAEKPKRRHSPPEHATRDGNESDLAQRLQNISLGDSSKPILPQETSGQGLEDALKDLSRPSSSSDKENNVAILRFSPPRLHTQPSPDRPVTPPQSPSKQRLQSPSKTKTRVPSPKIRQSLDVFWNAEAVNEWNDQYSPRKTLKSPKKPLRPAREDEASSPTTSPRKGSQSPSKRNKAAREAKQAFEDKKHNVAETFLNELDDTITDGQIRALAASTGGVRFIWSRTLNSTAGRANWRRETAKIRKLDGTTETVVKHHASIELAEKVIDDEHRLLNVIAHEFCHLANFMVSGIKDQPHGKQFRAWGAKVTETFGDRGVEVTTKHSYEIEYRYIWRCSGEDCGHEFKRHSKSIDPKRHTCGSCRGGLVQIRPTPRNTNASSAATGAGGYAAFVKRHFAATKSSLPPGSSQKAVMEALGAKYRAEKAEAAGQASRDFGVPEAESRTVGEDDGMSKLAEKIEVIDLDD